MDLIELIRKGRVKRVFRATRKITAPMVVSHLTQRAAGREPLFIEDGDYLSLLADLKEISQKRGLAVFALCLMPNHVHLLVRPEADELDASMRDLFGRFVARFNRKYERRGHLCCGPYRQAVCLDEGYLLAISLYIHNNPVRAGLAKTAADYRWSSARLYCSDHPPESFVNPDFILRMLHGAEGGRAVYRRLLDASQGFDTGHVFERADALDRFRNRLVAVFPRLFQSLRPFRKVVDLDLLDSEQLEQLIAEERQARVHGHPRTTEATRFLVDQLIARGFSRKEIAARLGICRKTVYNLTRRQGDRFVGYR